jgi:hypothetical protein
MSLFVEVDSLEKQCPVIVNLDMVIEIAPLVEGGCALFMADGHGGAVSMKVKNDYTQFKQFVLQTVSVEDIAQRFPTKTKVKDLSLDIPKL